MWPANFVNSDADATNGCEGGCPTFVGGTCTACSDATACTAVVTDALIACGKGTDGVCQQRVHAGHMGESLRRRQPRQGVSESSPLASSQCWRVAHAWGAFVDEIPAVVIAWRGAHKPSCHLSSCGRRYRSLVGRVIHFIESVPLTHHNTHHTTPHCNTPHYYTLLYTTPYQATSKQSYYTKPKHTTPRQNTLHHTKTHFTTSHMQHI
jgi:hypothetical protein